MKRQIPSEKLRKGRTYRMEHCRFGTALVLCIEPAKDGGEFEIVEGALGGINDAWLEGDKIRVVNDLARFYSPSKTTGKNIRQGAKRPFVPMEHFGADHWSTFLYIETRVVDHHGEPDRRQMRCDKKRHPLYAHIEGKCPPTRYRLGELKNHDDWDCVADLVTSGLLLSVGTGMHPKYELSPLGWQVAMLLRQHRAGGGKFSDFAFQTPTAHRRG